MSTANVTRAQPRSLAVRVSMRMNRVVDLVLRSRCHWLLSRGLALITVTGRRTGRRYTIPVGYLETSDAVVVLVGDAPTKTWWRNYRQPGPIEMRLRGVQRSGRAVVVQPGSEQFRRVAEASFAARASFLASSASRSTRGASSRSKTPSGWRVALQ